MRLHPAALLSAAASLPALVRASAPAADSFKPVHAWGRHATMRRFHCASVAAGVAAMALLAGCVMDDAVQVAQTKQASADAMPNVAADARRAYIEAVAAQQAALYAEQVRDSAEAGAELASRMFQAGNFSRLDYAREQAFYAESVAQLAQARQQALAAREKLTRTMGIRGDPTRYTLPERLPDLPKERPDLAELGRDDARSEVRESYSAYVTAYDVARHYRDDVVPLRKTISDEMLLRYNGMLASVFDLLADSREQAGAVNRYIEALKRYWLARTDLEQALGARLPAADGAVQAPSASSPQMPATNSKGQ